MSRFIEILHEEWVAASLDVVRRHYADLQHRRDAGVHPGERIRLLAPSSTGPRYERRVRQGLRRRRELVERRIGRDGSIIDAVVGGANWGRATSARFWRRNEGSMPGTLVELTVTQPVLPVVGAWVERWVRRRIERELREFALEDKLDIERSCRAGPDLRAA